MTDLGSHPDRPPLEQALRPDSPIERAIAVTGEEEEDDETNQGQSAPQPAEGDESAAPAGAGSPRG